MSPDRSTKLAEWCKSELWILREDVRRFVFDLFANRVLGAAVVPRRLRTFGYRCLGMDVAPTANIWPHVHFTGRQMTIGPRVMINSHCRFENAAPISLAEDVSIGPGASFVTSTHEFGPTSRRAAAVLRRPVTVQAGAWVGAQALVLPGVVIGKGSVVGAGSTVTRSVDEDVLVTGVPAKVARPLS